jgi:hypothetical protein
MNNDRQEIASSKDTLSSKIRIEEEKEDAITQNILDKIQRKMMNVWVNNKKVFQFFIKEGRSNLHYLSLVLFNKIFILEYLSHNYFFYNAEENYYQIMTTKYKIVDFFLDLTTKSLQAHNLILLIQDEKIKGKTNTFHLKKFNFNKFYSKDQNTYFTKISGSLNSNEKIKNLFLTKNRTIKNITQNSLNCYFEFSDKSNSTNLHFILLKNNNIYLFEKFSHCSILIHTLDINFASLPYPVVINSKFYIASSEKFIYKLDLSLKNKEHNFYSIFKDMTLNFNNEKYNEMLETLKIILYYNLEIDSLSFSEVKNYMKNIFEEYDIFSYVESLTHTLNSENVILFLSYNLNNAKLFVIFIYCLVFENYKFITNLFKFIIESQTEDDNNYHYNSSNNSDFSLCIKSSSYSTDLQFIAYLFLFEDFVFNFFKEFPKINLKEFMREINIKIFEDDYFKNFLEIINNYINTLI